MMHPLPPTLTTNAWRPLIGNGDGTDLALFLAGEAVVLAILIAIGWYA